MPNPEGEIKNLSPDEGHRVGEVVEASTADFVAQCYELYQLPPLGSLVKTRDQEVELYGVVCNATTAGLEPGRRPIARGRDEATEEAVYQSSPQLMKLLRSEFSVLVAAHRQEGKLYHYLPPKPARIHSFVYQCPPAEVKELSQSLDFLTVLLNARLPVSPEELIAACLRHMGQAQEDRRAFLVAAGKELAVLLGDEPNRLRAVLGRIKP
ncbi:MAG: hypothetical protein HY530_06730 [Chloroflexi bacterium]|nr:hypothetical protein [Chloroflexota bacterium]